MSRLLTSTIGHTLCSSSSPVLPPPAAVLALALGHGGDLHAVAAIIGPWGSHGDVVLLWPCPATTCMLAMVAACMPWLLDTSFNRSLGSPYSFVHYVRTASLPQVSNLGSLSTHKLWPSLWPELWVERQSKAALINMWGFDDVPCPPVHFRPHCGKNFHAIFFFLCAHQILTRTKLTWNQLLIFGGNNWYTKLHMFEFEEDVDSEFTAAFVEKLLNIC